MSDSNSFLDDFNSLYQEFLNERELYTQYIQENKDKIKEIELYTKSLFEHEDVEYGVFSPRNVHTVYKEKIDSQNKEKEALKKKNYEYQNKIYRIEEKMEKLNHLKDSFSKQSNDEKVDVNYLVLDMQEKERQRIARDLHDHTVQNLTHLIHQLELSTKYMDTDLIRAKMEIMDVSKNVKAIIKDMRDIIFDLRPMEFDDIGLKETLEKYFCDIQQETGIHVEYKVDNFDFDNRLSNISVFHMIKECINNCIKYSKASEIKIIVKKEKSLIQIRIEDDGDGFDMKKPVNNHHFGLSLVKESVSILRGKFQIDSKINKGTKILIEIPV